MWSSTEGDHGDCLPVMDYDGDIQGFLAAYSRRLLKTRGKRPSTSTMRTKASHVRRTIDLAELSSLDQLMEIVGNDRQIDPLVNQIFDALSIRSVPTRLHALKSLAAYGIEQGLIEACAIRPDHFPRGIPKRAVTFYSRKETEALLRAATPEGLRWWMFWMALAGTGRRIHEILDLRWQDIHVSEEPQYLYLAQTKGSLGESVPLPSALVSDVLTESNLRLIRRTAFRRATSKPAELHPFPWHYQSAVKCLQRMCARSGVEYRGSHELRRTEITRRLLDGMPLQAVSALAGHKSPRTTLDYYNGNGPMSYWRYVNPTD